jgi:hypothetical protein
VEYRGFPPGGLAEPPKVNAWRGPSVLAPRAVPASGQGAALSTVGRTVAFPGAASYISVFPTDAATRSRSSDRDHNETLHPLPVAWRIERRRWFIRPPPPRQRGSSKSQIGNSIDWKRGRRWRAGCAMGLKSRRDGDSAALSFPHPPGPPLTRVGEDGAGGRVARWG